MLREGKEITIYWLAASTHLGHALRAAGGKPRSHLQLLVPTSALHKRSLDFFPPDFMFSYPKARLKLSSLPFSESLPELVAIGVALGDLELLTCHPGDVGLLQIYYMYSHLEPTCFSMKRVKFY